MCDGAVLAWCARIGWASHPAGNILPCCAVLCYAVLLSTHTDDDLRVILSKLPEGVKFTMIAGGSVVARAAMWRRGICMGNWWWCCYLLSHNTRLLTNQRAQCFAHTFITKGKPFVRHASCCEQPLSHNSSVGQAPMHPCTPDSCNASTPALCRHTPWWCHARAHALGRPPDCTRHMHATCTPHARPRPAS